MNRIDDIYKGMFGYCPRCGGLYTGIVKNCKVGCDWDGKEVCFDTYEEYLVCVNDRRYEKLGDILNEERIC